MNRLQSIPCFILLSLVMLLASCKTKKQNQLCILSETGWQETDSFNFIKKQAFIFFDSECPVCNLYTHTLASLSKEYQTVNWYLIIPKHSDTSNAIEYYYQNFGFKGVVIYDPDNYLVKKHKATTTPQVVLVDKDKQVYSGKIDNKVKALGSFLDYPSEHYLRDAIEALLAKKEPQIKYTKPVGCLIQ